MAWNTHNPDTLAAFYLNAPDLVVYDATPLKYQGWQEFKSGIQTHLFDKLDRFELTAHDDLHATRNGDLVWVTFTYHLSAALKNGQPIKAEGRQTDLWQQHNGKWLIIHEHTSAPVSL
jgi:ketosteroid isomerase-like protein